MSGLAALTLIIVLTELFRIPLQYTYFLTIIKGCQGLLLVLASIITSSRILTFRHRASCILGQAFHYSPENAFYIFNQQIYFII